MHGMIVQMVVEMEMIVQMVVEMELEIEMESSVFWLSHVLGQTSRQHHDSRTSSSVA